MGKICLRASVRIQYLIYYTIFRSNKEANFFNLFEKNIQNFVYFTNCGGEIMRRGENFSPRRMIFKGLSLYFVQSKSGRSIRK